MGNKVALVLVSVDLAEQPCQCGELIAASDGLLGSAIAAMQLDDSQGAVEGAIKRGVKVRELETVDNKPEPEPKTAPKATKSNKK